MDIADDEGDAGSGGAVYVPGAEPASGFGASRSTFGTTGSCGRERCGTIPTIHYQTLDPNAHVGTTFGAMHGRTGGTVCTLPGPQSVVMSGELDKATIRRYVQRQIERLTYCYETALLGGLSVSGDVALSFTIDPAGRVHGVVANGFSSEVDRCVSTVIGNIEFPRSAGGGTTQVSYPLVFRQAR